MKKTPKCDQCDSVTINGVYCHEFGCPNRNKFYDVDSNSWCGDFEDEDFEDDEFDEDEFEEDDFA